MPGAAPVFASYLIVDWSAAARPRTGPDSIWIAGHAREPDGRLTGIAPVNPATRAAASAHLAALLPGLLDRGRVLLGFDFPLGYPAGTAAALGLGGQGLGWRRLWSKIADVLDDGPDNANNRFALAAGFNRALGPGPGPFWGCPDAAAGPALTRRKPPDKRGPAERRITERRCPRTQPVWKLMGVGAAGSQALTGIPRVWALRRDPAFAFRAAVWPFETGFRDDPRAALLIAEVYPALVPPAAIDGLAKDAGQVMGLAGHLAQADADGRLARWLGPPAGLTPAERDAVLREEGWILGIT